VHIPNKKGQFSGLFGPFKSIGNLRCSGRCKRDHSIANNIMHQNGLFGMQGQRKYFKNILKISERRRCGLSAAKRVVGMHSEGEV